MNIRIEIVFCDGAGDGGIDAAFLLRGEDGQTEGDTWYLIQSKYGSAFQSQATLISESQKLFDTLSGRRTALSSITSDLVERLRNFIQSSSDKDKLVLVFATADRLNNDEKRTLDHIRLIGRSEIGSVFDVDSVSIETIYRRMQEREVETHKLGVEISGQLTQSGPELLVGSVKLTDLYDFLKRYKGKTGDLDVIYEKNVRKFLGGRRKVNNGIAKTITEHPEVFGLYNNGITIVVEEFEQYSDGTSVLLTEPFIVNGCQTTKTVWNVLQNVLDSGGTGVNDDLESYKDRLRKGMVIVKIVKVGSQGEDLLMEILVTPTARTQ